MLLSERVLHLNLVVYIRRLQILYKQRFFTNNRTAQVYKTLDKIWEKYVIDAMKSWQKKQEDTMLCGKLLNPSTSVTLVKNSFFWIVVFLMGTTFQNEQRLLNDETLCSVWRYFCIFFSILNENKFVSFCSTVFLIYHFLMGIFAALIKTIKLRKTECPKIYLVIKVPTIRITIKSIYKMNSK